MENFDLGPLVGQFMTWQNGLILVACGAAMEAFKRGPGTRRFAETRWGQALAYYAPVFWAWAALFLPIGLAREGATIGEKLMLGVALGTLSDSIYDWTVQALKRLLRAQATPASTVLPEDRPK
jgi:hypothetical protein